MSGSEIPTSQQSKIATYALNSSTGRSILPPPEPGPLPRNFRVLSTVSGSTFFNLHTQKGSHPNRTSPMRAPTHPYQQQQMRQQPQQQQRQPRQHAAPSKKSSPSMQSVRSSPAINSTTTTGANTATDAPRITPVSGATVHQAESLKLRIPLLTNSSSSPSLHSTRTPDFFVLPESNANRKSQRQAPSASQTDTAPGNRFNALLQVSLDVKPSSPVPEAPFKKVCSREIARLEEEELEKHVEELLLAAKPPVLETPIISSCVSTLPPYPGSSQSDWSSFNTSAPSFELKAPSAEVHSGFDDSIAPYLP